MVRSCGLEGFKNAKKGTNVAAQATGIAMAVVSIFTFFVPWRSLPVGHCGAFICKFWYTTWCFVYLPT